MGSHQKSSYLFPTLPSPAWAIWLKNQIPLGHTGLVAAWNLTPRLTSTILTFELQVLNFPVREARPLESPFTNGPLSLGQSVTGSVLRALSRK